MIASILVVCMGNVCRSPFAERQIAHFLPQTAIHSAGFIATPGIPADTTMAMLAQQNGINLASHRSQKFTLELGIKHELILIMDAGQGDIIKNQYPQLSGKCRLLSHWNGREDIPDPYRKSLEFYKLVYQQMVNAAIAWKQVLQD